MANAKSALSGGLGGAASGAAIGSAVPGIGTAIGAIGGGILGALPGLFSGDDDTKPQLPPIVDPVTGQQIQRASGVADASIGRQSDFVNALQAQNGIGNQSQVYNQLQGIAAGTGPNPAQAMLNQATGANTANQAALMASQRGAGANTGLIARQAAMQGAANQQNAAGQAATLQANQSLNAINGAGNIATQQVGQQQNALNSLNQFAQSNQGQLLGAQAAYNSALTGGQGSVNAANQEEANRNAAQMGGMINGAGAAATAIAGGMKAPQIGTAGGMSSTGQLGSVTLPSGGTPNTVKPETLSAISGGGMYAAANGGQVPGPSSFVGRHLAAKPQMLAQGGKVDALVSPGERYLSPAAVKQVAEGKKSPMKAGEKIPGKPKVGGDTNSYANDTVSKKLEAGGVVLPRSVTQAKNPGKAAEKFVAAILSKQGLK